ncbi:MAG: hypothetical protein JW915_21110 [Chitinispirillaceae bacterium]|nr:hypothetical protein [Chitinispirillaceae bacterium]
MADAGQNLVSIKVLSDGDTLENSIKASQFLHGQKRIMVCNSNYLSDGGLDFRIVADSADVSKIMIEQRIDKYTVALKDTSITYKEIKFLIIENLKAIPIKIFKIPNLLSRRICFKDAIDGQLTVWGQEIIPLNVETDPNGQLTAELGNAGEIIVRYPAGMKLFKSADVSLKNSQLIPDVNNYFECTTSEKSMKMVRISWDEFKTHFLSQPIVYVTHEKKGQFGFSISYRAKGKTEEYLKENVSVGNITVTVEPSFDVKVGAEEGRQYLSFVLRTEDEYGTDLPFINGMVHWTITQGQADGILSSVYTRFGTNPNNIAEVWLNAGTIAAKKFKVRGEVTELAINGIPVNNIHLSSESAEITVVSAPPNELLLNPNRTSIPFDNHSTASFLLTVRDVYDNPFEGMNIEWSIAGDARIIYEENKFTGGNARLDVQAGITPSAITVTASVTNENSSDKRTAVIYPELFTLSVVPDSYALDVTSTSNSTTIVRLSAAGVADGTPVYWYTTNGTIIKNTTITDGTSSTVLNVYNAHLGVTLVGAKVGQKWIVTPKVTGGAQQPIIAYAPTGSLSAYADHKVLYDDYAVSNFADPDQYIEITSSDPDFTFDPVSLHPATRVYVTGNSNEFIKVSGVNIQGFDCPESDPDCPPDIDNVVARIPSSPNSNILQLDGTGKGEIHVFTTGNFASNPQPLVIPVKTVKLTSLTIPRQFEVPLRCPKGATQVMATNLWQGFLTGQGSGVSGFAGDMIANSFFYADVRDLLTGLYDYGTGGSVNSLAMVIAGLSIGCDLLPLTGIGTDLSVLCNYISLLMKKALKVLPTGPLKSYITEVFNDLIKEIADLCAKGDFRNVTKSLNLFKSRYGGLL